MASRKVILLTCNWNAYSGLETAGAERLAYPAGVYPLKVACLGQINPGIILKAFEKGADGVLMLGCPPGQCHYEFGNRRAEEVYAQAKELVKVLGCSDSRLQLDWVSAGEGQDLVNKVRVFVAGLNGARSRR
ncbi:MAG: hydrogenase iron-sulfur subunit [Chloroflexota bacterium]